jgi:GMP synthase PP-ATPase subunit
MERGAHERRVERRAHVLVRRRLEHSRLDLKRHKAPSVVISGRSAAISGDQRRSAAN